MQEKDGAKRELDKQEAAMQLTVKWIFRLASDLLRSGNVKSFVHFPESTHAVGAVVGVDEGALPPSAPTTFEKVDETFDVRSHHRI